MPAQGCQGRDAVREVFTLSAILVTNIEDRGPFYHPGMAVGLLLYSYC